MENYHFWEITIAIEYNLDLDKGFWFGEKHLVAITFLNQKCSLTQFENPKIEDPLPLNDL